MEITSLLLENCASSAQDIGNGPKLSMAHPSAHLQIQTSVMPSESPRKQSLPGNYCPTPPSASPSKDDFVGAMSQQGSPLSPAPKHVSFELLLDDNSKVRARIPMRVQIFPHDTTDSIVTTVKNFYGIYEATASGVSFEDENGITLIARYENLRNNMTVYVRVIPNDHYGHQPYYGSTHADGFNRPALGEPFQMPPPHAAQDPNYGQSPSRPGSRVAGKRSTSPSGRGRRSGSIQKALSRAGNNKSRGSSAHGSFNEDALAHYSDSDGTHESITGSKKARSEHFASSDISMENILLDGRRKRPKFDSSELPLFAPPQVPLTTSTSSISPQRRSTAQEGASPFSASANRPFAMNQPLPSPQSFGHHEQLYALHNGQNQQQYPTPTGPQHGHKLRDRSKMQPANYYSNSNNRSSGSGILPTPDPTIASCISDEDVAMQLIRLGDASNFSHGRTSASTADDAFSGIADAASSAGATSDGSVDGDELPHQARQKAESSPMLAPGMMTTEHKNLDDILPSCDTSEPSSDEGNFQQEGLHGSRGKGNYEPDPHYEEHAIKRAKHNGKGNGIKTSAPKQSSTSKTNKTTKARPLPASRKGKTHPAAATNKSMGPPPPANMTNQAARSTANLQQRLVVGDEDLSTKPRCQRCRKSKKGCDRQRPCQRCKDAGIGVDGCISEDEGNGRKGRYGRHMGVPVQQTGSEISAHAPEYQVAAVPPSTVPTSADKNKKRKR